jgi:hypothetical protein
MVWNEDMKADDTTNFLLLIPFAAANTHMEGLTRKGYNITCIIDGQISAAPFKGIVAFITNHLAHKRIMFSYVCECNLR